VEAYRTVPVALGDDERERVRSADVITFTSSSTVTNFLDSAGANALPPVVAAIGPVTAQTARDAGVVVDVVAKEHTIDGLVAAIEAWAAG
ncbi:MAG: uroporphyrinogen-III synthase, partial [Acidimicrobiales bacterium]